jgi:ABC-type spermidine/putrescine transport system permease subunit II
VSSRSRLLFRIWLGVVFVFLFLPLAMVIALSFNASRFGTLPFVFTTHWYGELFARDELLRSVVIDLQLSLLVGLSAALLGSLLALWMTRASRRLVIPVSAGLVSAVTVPWLILGVAMLLVLQKIGLGRSFFSMYLGCLAVSLPYVVFIVAARLQGTDASIEEAARSLGAGAVQTFVRITVPIAAPAIVAGTLMAFVTAFNNFVIQYFLAPLGVRTLPLEIYGMVRNGYQPDINALGTILVAASIVLVCLLQWITGNAGQLVSGAERAGPRR